MIDVLQKFWDGISGKRTKSENTIYFEETMTGLEESTRELRNKLDNPPEYIITRVEPIREHVVPSYPKR